MYPFVGTLWNSKLVFTRSGTEKKRGLNSIENPRLESAVNEVISFIVKNWITEKIVFDDKMTIFMIWVEKQWKGFNEWESI